MREWNLKVGDPLSCVLAADAHLGPADYGNDQIWELSMGGGEPPALALQTTYGLRARSLRLFPRFIEGDLVTSDPATFSRPPSIHSFYPNLLMLSFAIFPGIECSAEYWVTTSQTVWGRFTVTNNTAGPRKIRLEWAATLFPSPDGERMSITTVESGPGSVMVLSGRTTDLVPVVTLSGGAVAGGGPYPCLALDLELDPGEAAPVIWAHAAFTDFEKSYEAARATACRNWDAERARIELFNSGQVEIHTGDPDWDAAFSLSQKVARGLFIGPTSHLPYPSFVLSRQPDQGFSMLGDGREYGHLWNGQSPLETYFLASLILPSDPQGAAGLLRNFLVTSGEEGFIDWKPGLAGQRGQFMATPLLASLAERIYTVTNDLAFLQEVFHPLLAFERAWFSAPHDRDGDGIPEWDHPMQACFDDHPLFSQWHPWTQGADITCAESPALCAFLYRECQTLIRMAALIDYPEPVPALMSLADHLRSVVEVSWDSARHIYRYWDRDSHYSTPAEVLAERQGPGEVTLQLKFDQPVRLLVRITTDGESTRRPHLFIHGTNPSGQHLIERILNDQFRWGIGQGTVTGERIYSYLERVEIQGLDPNDRVVFQSAGFSGLDQTLLLPLWAGIPSVERASLLVANTLASPTCFWQPYGLPACIPGDLPPEAETYRSVNVPWNALLGEGLLAYGYRKEAASLVTRIMTAITRSLKQEGAFRRVYDSLTGQGRGERNALEGLAPLGLFLDTLGVRLVSPRQVALQGNNPFPWPVTVKYRGLTVLRQLDKTIVIFPDGQTTFVTDPAPCVVSLQ